MRRHCVARRCSYRRDHRGISRSSCASLRLLWRGCRRGYFMTTPRLPSPRSLGGDIMHIWYTWRALGVFIILNCVFKPAHHLKPASLKTLQRGLQISFTVGYILLFSVPGSAQTTTNAPAPANGASTFPSPTFPDKSTTSTASAFTTMAVPAADQSHYLISPGDELEVSVLAHQTFHKKQQ